EIKAEETRYPPIPHGNLPSDPRHQLYTPTPANPYTRGCDKLHHCNDGRKPPPSM
ncbi:hypothetical protein FRX31_009697, partial [Thalictrum thalictroides]